MNWQALIGIGLAVLIGWFIMRLIRHNPTAFSKANFSKSLRTLGLLALFLIVIIFVAVSIVKK